ncbi:unnamed protein product [Caretta caretta]
MGCAEQLSCNATSVFICLLSGVDLIFATSRATITNVPGLDFLSLKWGSLVSQKPPAKCKGLLSCSLLTVLPEIVFDTDSGNRKASSRVPFEKKP